MANYSHDELTKRLTAPGWQRVTASGETETGTLKEMAAKAHAERMAHPGTIREIETAVELELLQLQQLWHYLALPD